MRQVVNYSPAAAHEVLKAIAEKTGMNPVAKVRVNGRLRKLTSKTLMQIHVMYMNALLKYLIVTSVPGPSHQLCNKSQSEDVGDIADTSGHISLSCGKNF